MRRRKNRLINRHQVFCDISRNSAANGQHSQRLTVNRRNEPTVSKIFEFHVTVEIQMIMRIDVAIVDHLGDVWISTLFERQVTGFVAEHGYHHHGNECHYADQRVHGAHPKIRKHDRNE